MNTSKYPFESLEKYYKKPKFNQSLNNCIQFVDPVTGLPTSDIPCASYKFDDFDNLNFNAQKFDDAIEKTFGNSAPWFKKSGSPFVFPKNYIDRKPDPEKIMHLQEQQKFASKYVNLHNNFNNGTLLYHSLGSGKCHEKGTPILMYDGSIKKVEEINQGEKLMGDDSTPRDVLELVRGKDTMYEIIPVKGTPFVCNSEHVLSLKCSNFGVNYANDKRYAGQTKFYVARIFNNTTMKTTSKWFNTREEGIDFLKQVPEKDKYCDISIQEYLKLSKSLQARLKLYRTGVIFKEKKVPFSPYIIGTWLGDGTGRSCEITNQDAEILNGIRNILKKDSKELYLSFIPSSEYGYRICSIKRTNEFMTVLKNLKLLNNKHIPDIYKINSRKVRLEILAGIIDTDGSLDANGGFEISQVNECLMDDIIYLARSLGFSAYKAIKKTSWTYKDIKKKSTAFRIVISGEGIENIPTRIKRKRASPRLQKKSVLVTGFKLKEKPVDNYYGFTINKNHRYLLGDFTVTHNSCSAIAIGEAFKQYHDNQSSVFVVVPNALEQQFKDEIIGTMARNGIINRCTADIRFNGKKIEIDETIYEEIDPLQQQEKSILKKTTESIKALSQQQTVAEYLNEKFKDKKDKEIIKMKWEFYTQDTFINRISKTSTNKEHRRETKKIMNSLKDGEQLVIFDEIQNLISKPDGISGGKKYQALRNLLDTISNKKNRYVFLTATPIRNKPTEIGLMLNLFNPRLHFPESDREFEKIFVKESGEIKNESLFNWMTKGYISYFKGGNPLFFPIKKVENIYHPMCVNQSLAYTDEIKKIMAKMNRRNDEKMIENSILMNSKDFMIKPRELSYSYMETIKYENKNTGKVLYKAIPLEKTIKNYTGGMALEYVQNNISPKLAMVAMMADKTKGKSFIYSEFIDYGIAPLVSLFKCMGYEIIYGNMIDYPNVESGTGETGEMGMESSDVSRIDNVGSVRRKRVLVWTGSKGILEHEPKADKIQKNMLPIFKSEKNLNGDYIKIVIGSSTIKEGVSFTSIRAVHLLGPWWNSSKTDQIIARAIRFGSHKPGETVNVYKHISLNITDLKKRTPGNSWLNSISVEQYMELVSTKKANINRQFELALKESSVDCKLNKFGNLIRSTEITDTLFMKSKGTSGGFAFKRETYFLNETTGITYSTKEDPNNPSRLLPDYKILYIGDPNMFGKVKKITLKKHGKKQYFPYITNKFPSVTAEQLDCNTKAKFEYNKENEKNVSEIVNTTMKIKGYSSLLATELSNTDNKRLLTCLSKTIIEDKKLSTEWKYYMDGNKQKQTDIIYILFKQFEEIMGSSEDAKQYIDRYIIAKKSNNDLPEEFEIIQDAESNLMSKKSSEIENMVNSFKRN